MKYFFMEFYHENFIYLPVVCIFKINLLSLDFDKAHPKIGLKQ